MNAPSPSPRIVAWPQDAGILEAWGFAVDRRALPPHPPMTWPEAPGDAPARPDISPGACRVHRRLSPTEAETAAWAAALAGLLAEHGARELILIASHAAAFEALSPGRGPLRQSSQPAETDQPAASGWRSCRLSPGNTPLARAIDRWLKGEAGSAGLRLAAAGGWLIMIRSGGLTVTAPVKPERLAPFGLDGA